MSRTASPSAFPTSCLILATKNYPHCKTPLGMCPCCSPAKFARRRTIPSAVRSRFVTGNQKRNSGGDGYRKNVDKIREQEWTLRSGLKLHDFLRFSPPREAKPFTRPSTCSYCPNARPLPSLTNCRGDFFQNRLFQGFKKSARSGSSCSCDTFFRERPDQSTNRTTNIIHWPGGYITPGIDFNGSH